MAKLEIDIPDGKRGRLLDAFCIARGKDPTQMTLKEQAGFLKSEVILWMKGQVQSGLERDTVETARTNAKTETEGINLT